MATRKRARPDHRHTKTENELRKDLDVAARTIEKQAEANLAAATALDRIIEDVATRAAMRAVEMNRVNIGGGSASIELDKMRMQHEHERQILAAQQQHGARMAESAGTGASNRRSDAPLGALAGTPTRVPPPPVLSGGGTSGPGSVATSRPVSLPMVIDQLAGSVDCFEGQLGDTFRTVGALLPPNFDLPEVPSTPIPTSSEPVMRIMQLIERIDRTRVRLSIITNSLTL